MNPELTKRQRISQADLANSSPEARQLIEQAAKEREMYSQAIHEAPGMLEAIQKKSKLTSNQERVIQQDVNLGLGRTQALDNFNKSVQQFDNQIAEIFAHWRTKKEAEKMARELMDTSSTAGWNKIPTINFGNLD